MARLIPINPHRARLTANPQAAAYDYNILSHKPKINHVELIGDKSSDDLGLQDKLTAGRNIVITNENVISANVNSIVGAYVQNGYLYIQIQDGEGIVSVEQVGYVRGSDGSDGRNGDGFTNAQINANGDLLVTTITYPNGNDYPVETVVNLGHVQGASDYNSLSNKPQINGVELTGNKSSDALDLQKKLIPGINITLNENGLISASGGLTIDRTPPQIFSTEQYPYTEGDLFLYNQKLYEFIGTMPGTYHTRNIFSKTGRRIVYSSQEPPRFEETSAVSSFDTGDLYVVVTSQASNSQGRLIGQDVYLCVETIWLSNGSNYNMQYYYYWQKIRVEDISNIVTAAAVNQNGTITITLSDGTTVTSTGAVIESTSNKVTAIDANSTNAEYPSAKAVYDAIQNISPPKTDISSATVTLSASSFTYDGTSKAPSVTSVVLNGTTLTEWTDYVVVAAPATNAGSYALTVNGIGDYTGTVTVNWSIAKAQAVISGDSTITISENDSPVSKTYTSDSDGAFSFSISDNTVASISNNGGTVTVTPLTVGTATITVTLAEGTNYFGATKTVALTVSQAVTYTVFGVCWDYSLSSPALTRLTPQTDPLGVVTNVPSTEPTACVGNDGNGQSDFDNYMPWAGMQRYNYVNGQVVDFVDYSNGETYVYIPEFWSKIINDTANNRMSIYISDSEISGFTKHPGSGKYMSRYECNSNFLSAPGTKPKVNTNLGGFRTGITAIDNKHYQYDIHTYAALELLYIVEFAHLNTQNKIGAGITSGGVALTVGNTDVLTYHTGRVNGTADNVSAVQYRWIENLWGNVWNWVDGILIQDGLVYICDDRANYANSITSDYESTGLYTPIDIDRHKTDQDYNDCYLIPLTTGSSDSTYTCDYYGCVSGLRGLVVGGSYSDGSGAGLFFWSGYIDPDHTSANIGGRAVLILN